MQTLIIDSALIPPQDSSLGSTQALALTKVLQALNTPHLKSWLQSAHEVQGLHLGEFDVHTPLEESIRCCLGEVANTHSYPVGFTARAHQAAQQLHPEAAKSALSDEGWAFLSLCHWHANSGQVFMLDAEPLNAHESEALRIELTSFFAQVGIDLFAYQPGVWLAKSALFHALPTASLARVMGQEVEPWLVGSTQDFPKAQAKASQSLKRLQSELQMLLYHHPLNQNRARALNSIWFSDTGNSSKDLESLLWLTEPWSKSERTPPSTQSRKPVWISQHLGFTHKHGDWLHWAQTLERLDSDLLAELNTLGFERLILCGTQSSKIWIRPQHRGIQKMLLSIKTRFFSRTCANFIFHENQVSSP
jgi:hypothetical protein